MNVFMGIMLAFATLGFADELSGGHLGLTSYFYDGIRAMGSAVLSMTGFYVIGVTFLTKHMDGIVTAASVLPFDPALYPSMLLSSDLGALPMAIRLAESEAMAVFTGGMVAAGMGVTVSYQMPLLMGLAQKKDYEVLMRGTAIGLTGLPFGLLAGGIMLRLPAGKLFLNMVPVLVLGAVILAALLMFPQGAVRFFVRLGKIIRLISLLFFALVVFGVFFPEHAYADPEDVKDILLIIFRITITMSGAMVFSHLLLKYCKKQIHFIGKKMGISNESVIGMVLSMSQSIAMMQLFPRMNKRGKLVNAAFAVGGAYMIGGHLVVVSTLLPSHYVFPYMVNKIVSSLAGILIALIMIRGESAKSR